VGGKILRTVGPSPELPSPVRVIPEQEEFLPPFTNPYPPSGARSGTRRVLAGPAPSLPSALHFHLGLLAESGRTLVRRALRVVLAPSPRLQKMPCKTLLQHLHHRRRSSPLRFAHEQMKMLRHDHISDHHKIVAAAHLSNTCMKRDRRIARIQHRASPITTGGEEMQISSAVVASQTLGHREIVSPSRG
jgi:hypothetical protein